MRDCEQEGPRQLTFRLWGEPGFSCRCRLLPLGEAPVPNVRVSAQRDGKDTAQDVTDDEFEVVGDSRVRLRW